MQVDHIIPERLEGDPSQLSSVLGAFGLSEGFSLNSYSNWLPSCEPCNRKKSGAVFKATPLVQLQLESARSKSAEVEKLVAKALSRRDITKALNTLERAKIKQQLSEEDRASLKPLIDFQEQERSSDLQYESIRLSPEYKVSPGRRHIVEVLVNYLGLDFVILTPQESLNVAFERIYKDTEAHGMHPSMPINDGAMTGLRSVGIINSKNVLTSFGVSLFKIVAGEQKADSTGQAM